MKKLTIGLFVALICPNLALGAMISPERVSDYINAVSMQNGVPVELMEAIAQAESNDDVNARNSSSTASSVYEFTNPSFKYWCIDTFHVADTMSEKNSYTTQVLCAVLVVKNYGTKPWQASRIEWEKHTDTS